MRTEILHTKDKKTEEETEHCDEGGNRSSPATEESPGILKLEDVDESCYKGGNRSSPAPEAPPGILKRVSE